MKTLFLLGALLGWGAWAQAQFFYKEYQTNTDKRPESGQAICVNKKGELVKTLSIGSAWKIQRYKPYDFDKFHYSTEERPYTYPHEIICLKNGGYAVAARNMFAILDSNENVVDRIGRKMTNWRSEKYGMEDWKANLGSSTGTAVDFLELAENPSGNYVASVFAWYQGEDIKLGLAVADMDNGATSKLFDLMATCRDYRNPIDISMEVEIAFLSDNLLLVGYNKLVSHEFIVVDVSKIISGDPLSAEKWRGKLVGAILDGIVVRLNGFFVDQGTVYYAFDKSIGRAVWDGKQMVSKMQMPYNMERSFQYICDYDKTHFLLSDTDTRVYKASKSDLGIFYQGEIHRYSAGVLDLCPLDYEKKEVVVLTRQNYYDLDPGPFRLGIIKLK